MNKRLMAALIFCVLFFNATHAQHDRAGTSAFPFLNIGVDAQALAMGGVSIGMPGDLYGGLSNPASIAFADRMQAMLAYRPVMLDIRAGAMGFSRPFDTKGTFGLNLLYVSYGLFEGVDINNEETGITYSPYSLVGGVSWSKIFIEDLAFGVALKGIYDNLDHGNSADGFAADLGMQYRMLSSRVIYGVAFTNIGLIRSWYDDAEKEDRVLPFTASAGISYLPRTLPSLRMAMDLQKRVDDYLSYRTGLEVALYKRYLFARIGYRFSHRDLEEAFRIIRSESDDTYQKTDWTSLTLGFGVAAPVAHTDIRIDAALVLHTEGLAPTPVISAIVGF